METVLQRFDRYVRIDTQSNPDTGCYPSTDSQKLLGRMLVHELQQLGLEADMDEFGIVMGRLASNYNDNIPCVGFLAHMDTSPDACGRVSPRVIESYDGKDIKLESGLVIKSCNELSRFVGGDLVVTDGTSLLGADDKAGISEIMTMIQYFQDHKDIKHGPVVVGFTPDEEIGRGTDHFSIEKFGAKYAYTVDGGRMGEINTSTFNAATGTFHVNGVNIHPGEGKDRMINAVSIATDILNEIPKSISPAETEGSEGYFHVVSVSATPSDGSIDVLIRDHSKPRFEEKKAYLRKVCDYIRKKWNIDPGTSKSISEAKVEIAISDSYYNMEEGLKYAPIAIDNIYTALKRIQLKPELTAIRGGTDGARLTEMGLPCPNLFSGAMNMHSELEWVSVEAMEKSVELLVEIVKIYGDNSCCS